LDGIETPLPDLEEDFETATEQDASERDATKRDTTERDATKRDTTEQDATERETKDMAGSSHQQQMEDEIPAPEDAHPVKIYEFKTSILTRINV